MPLRPFLLILALFARPCRAETAVMTEAELHDGVEASAPGLEMSVILLRGSGWTEEQAREQLREAARVYARCAIRLRRVSLVSADPPGGRVNWNRFDREGPASLAELRRLLPGDGLTAYLTGAFLDENIDDAFAFADWRDAYVTRPELNGTLFLSDRVNSPGSRRERSASPFSVLAHEMLHVLIRSARHNGDPEANLLSDWRRRSDAILPRHCAAAAASPLLKAAAP